MTGKVIITWKRLRSEFWPLYLTWIEIELRRYNGLRTEATQYPGPTALDITGWVARFHQPNTQSMYSEILSFVFGSCSRAWQGLGSYIALAAPAKVRPYQDPEGAVPFYWANIVWISSSPGTYTNCECKKLKGQCWAKEKYF